MSNEQNFCLNRIDNITFDGGCWRRFGTFGSPSFWHYRRSFKKCHHDQNFVPSILNLSPSLSRHYHDITNIALIQWISDTQISQRLNNLIIKYLNFIKWTKMLINNMLLANYDQNSICTKVILNLRKIRKSYFFKKEIPDYRKCARIKRPFWLCRSWSSFSQCQHVVWLLVENISARDFIDSWTWVWKSKYSELKNEMNCMKSCKRNIFISSFHDPEFWTIDATASCLIFMWVIFFRRCPYHFWTLSVY